MDMSFSSPDGFDFKSWQRDHTKHSRAIEQQRDALKSYLPAIQRIAHAFGQGQKPTLAADQSLVLDCIKFTLTYISHSIVEETMLRMQSGEIDTPSPHTDDADDDETDTPCV